MNNTDKFLFYVVWGAIIGAGLYYGFHYSRGLTSSTILQFSQQIMSPDTENPEFIAFILNLLHAFLSSIVISLIAAFFIVKVLKTKNIKYCAIPSVIVLILSIWPIASNLSYYTISTIPIYLTSPIILVSMFTGSVWLIVKFTAPKRDGYE